MSETHRSTEEYWGKTVSITAEPQADGRWKATAIVGSTAPSTTESVAAPFHVQDQTSAEAASAAARSLATGAIDAGRVSQGKP